MTARVVTNTRIDRKKRDAKVRARIFLAHDRRCHVCGEKIARTDAWDLDHVIPLALGGDDDEGNLAPAHRKTCHRTKSRKDIRDIRQAQRREAVACGFKVSKRPIQSAPFAKAAPQRRASTRLTKDRLPPRSLYAGA